MSESSNRPVIALVLGIVGIVCCNLCAPFAWFIGKQELNAISAGASPEAGRGLAMAGMVLGIIGTILMVFVILWIFLWGGLAMMQGFTG